MMHQHPITVVNKHHGVTGEYIGRGSPLGNPYPIGPGATREQVIALYDRWLNERINDGDTAVCDELTRLFKLSFDRPVNLVCFCKPKACHGDIIKDLLVKTHAELLERKA